MSWFLGMPMLRLPEMDKYKDDCKWFKDVMNYHLPYAGMANYLTAAQEKMLDNYKYLNNKFEFADWEDVCKELGIDENQFSSGNLIVNVIPVIINYLKTTELRRNDTYTPILLTQQAMIEKDEQIKQAISNYVNGQIQGELAKNQRYTELMQAMQQNGQQMDAKMAEQIQTELQAIEAEYQAQYPTPKIDGFMSELEIVASKIIQYATYNNKVKYKKVKNDCFEDVLLNDGEIVRIVTDFDGVHFERVNLPYFMFHKSPETEYVQDSMWAAYTKMFTSFQLMNEFPEITDDNFANLGLFSYNIETPSQTINTKHHDKYPEWDAQALITKGLPGYDEHRAYGIGELPYLNRERLIPVTHFEFVGMKKVGFLRTIDEFGKEIVDFVDESFNVPKGAVKVNQVNEWNFETEVYNWDNFTLTWYWIPRRYEGYRIGINFYTRMREVPNQPINIDNPFQYKLSYHGKFYSRYNSEGISSFERLKPYNVLYMVIFNKLMKMVERWHGFLIPIDPSAIPIEFGETADERVEKYLQFQKDGYLIQNTFAEEGRLTRPAPSIIPLEIGNTFTVLQNLLNWIKTEMGLIVGVSPQALSQMISGNVTDNQQALRQTSYMIDPVFQQHNWVWQEVMTGYLNTFFEWAKDKMEDNPDGHRLSYIFNQNMREMLQMKPENLEFAYMGVVVSNSNPKEYYDFMMAQSQAMVQNQLITEVEISRLVLAMQSGESPYEIHKAFIEAKDRREARDKQLQEQQMQVEQMRQQGLKLEYDHQKEMKILEGQLAKELEEVKGKFMLEKQAMQVYQFQENQDTDNNGVPDAIEAGKLQHTINANNQKMELEKQRLLLDSRSQSLEEIKHEESKEEKEKDRQNSLQIASLKAKNKNTK